jgi:hypothetical protein
MMFISRFLKNGQLVKWISAPSPGGVLGHASVSLGTPGHVYVKYILILFFEFFYGSHGGGYEEFRILGYNAL